MTVTWLSAALGVPPSTLPFREEAGLLVPGRVTSLRARRCDPSAAAAARIVVALRDNRHGIPDVRAITASLDRFEGLDEARRLPAPPRTDRRSHRGAAASGRGWRRTSGPPRAPRTARAGRDVGTAGARRAAVSVRAHGRRRVRGQRGQGRGARPWLAARALQGARFPAPQ
ncbi:MerR family transcriptional regulator [Streptomyces tropicalis]|uniref:MerR family transcriptional regulator n=1 Tax=Streptomyces tropicalis TaxID=3034234 RepID=UPI0034D971F5